jgi:hypothetical protein
MGATIDPDDALLDLPPLPPLGEGEEDALGLDVGGEDEQVDAGEDERVGLDTAEGMAEGIGELDLIDDVDDEGPWTEGSEVAEGLVSLDTLVEGDEAEYGHLEGTQDEGVDDGGLADDALDLHEPAGLREDGGAEGLEDAGADLFRHGDGDDDMPGLPPLDADAADEEAGDLDLGDEDKVDVPADDPRDD